MNAFRKQREALEEFDLWMQAARHEASTTSQLVALLASQDRAVVLGAVKALTAIKARSALPALVALLARNDKELTSAVEAAISAMAAPVPAPVSEATKH
jgi:HEAT repeat protein